MTTPLLERISSEPLCAKGKALECEEGAGDTKEGGETVGNGIAQEGERCGASVRCVVVLEGEAEGGALVGGERSRLTLVWRARAIAATSARRRRGARLRCARVFVFDTAPLCARGIGFFDSVFSQGQSQ